MNRFKRLFCTSKRKTGKEVSNVENVEDSLQIEPSAVFERAEELEKMADALKILNEKERAILRMRHQDGLTWEEIGSIISQSADAARKTHGRIIGLLRSAMGLKVDVDWLENAKPSCQTVG